MTARPARYVEAELDALAAIADLIAQALSERRRTVITRGGGIARRVVADPEADALIVDYWNLRGGVR